MAFVKKKLRPKRRRTAVQTHVDIVRAERTSVVDGLAKRSSESSLQMENAPTAVVVRETVAMVRGDREPPIVMMPDGTVRLAPLAMLSELGDGDHE